MFGDALRRKPPDPAATPGWSPERQRLSLQIDYRVDLAWRDEQSSKILQARGLELSSSHLMVRAAAPLPRDTAVFVDIPELCLTGSGVVNGSAPDGSHYLVQLRLGEPLSRTIVGSFSVYGSGNGD